MNKAPRILLASVGFLVAAMLVDATNAGHVVAESVKTQLVQVVNTPSEAIPVAGQVGIDPTQNTVKVDASTASPLPVAGTVGLANNASVGINAAQNTVKIDTASPLNVRDVSSHTIPWQMSVDVYIPNNHGNVSHDVPLNLPAGKRLVVKEVSVNARLRKNDDGKGAAFAAGYLRTSSSVGWGDHQIMLTPVMEYWNGRTFAANQEMHAYADSGRPLHLYFERDNFKDEAMFRVAITGYLIDAQ